MIAAATPLAAAMPPRLAPLASYGLLGMPLAFAALPIYVHWPSLAASHWGLPLAGLGALLLCVRVLDAAVDPLVGRCVDRWLGRGLRTCVLAMAVGGLMLTVGLATLFLHRPAHASSNGLSWALAAAALLTTSMGFSVAQILHQAWGARLASPDRPAATWIAAREAAALGGVLAASVLPSMLGWGLTLPVLGLLLLAGMAALTQVPAPQGVLTGTAARPLPGNVGSDHRFRRLLGVHALTGIASAVPATLIAFYVADVLGAGAQLPWLLLTYFAAAGASTPLWSTAVSRFGGWPCWGAAMGLGLVAFAAVLTLGHGAVGAFYVVCVITGAAFGGETIASQACLIQHVDRLGASGRSGAAFGWWALVAKANLALAAGLALPLLGASGYAPGAGGPTAALVLAYAAMPCALKLAALALWWPTWRASSDSRGGRA